MKKIILLLVILPNYAFAGSFSATLGGSYKTYTYDIIADGNKSNYFQETFPSIKYSFTYVTKSGIRAGFAGDNTIDVNDLTVVNPNFSTNTSAEISRSDYALYAAYPVNKKITLLTGYRQATSDINYLTSNSNEKDKIKTYGPYIGFQYQIYSTPSNNIKASFYLNKLNTDFSLFSEEADFKFNFEGIGYAASLGWLHKLSKNNFISMSLEAHNYDHGNIKNSNLPVEDFSIEETAYSARLEFIHIFSK